MNDNEHIKSLVLSVFPLKRFLYNKDGNIYIGMHALPKLLSFLHDDKRCQMGLIDIYTDETNENTYTVTYFLKNFEMNAEFKISVETKDKLPSASAIFANASALECEIYDFDGIYFTGNDDLRRTITDPLTINGHPFNDKFKFCGTVTPFYNLSTKSIDIKEYSEPDYDIE